METKNTIRIVGYYTIPFGSPEDCTECHNADYGDVLINGICGRCLLERTKQLENAKKIFLAQAGVWHERKSQ